MSTTVKFPHKQFLENNREIIKQHPIPEMLQRRIDGFNALEEDLQHTTDEDTDELVEKLENLSLELDEDLEEHFMELLDNNDQDEEEEPEPAPVHLPEKKIEVKVETKKPAPKTETKSSDSDILEKLVKEKRFVVWPSELTKLGFRTQLGSRQLTVGKFLLRRGRYANYYTITKQSK